MNPLQAHGSYLYGKLILTFFTRQNPSPDRLNIALTTYHKDQSLNNATAHALATRVFKEILKARSCKDLLQIVASDPVLYRNRLDRKDYPELRLFISTEEIKALKASGVLTQNGRLNADLSATNMSPLEKLLYVIAWKNGDLTRVTGLRQGSG